MHTRQDWIPGQGPRMTDWMLAGLPSVILTEGGKPECGLGLDSRGGHENDGGEGGADEGASEGGGE